MWDILWNSHTVPTRNARTTHRIHTTALSHGRYYGFSQFDDTFANYGDVMYVCGLWMKDANYDVCGQRFSLGPKDALVVALRTPPCVEYFGLQAVDFLRSLYMPSLAGVADAYNLVNLKSERPDPTSPFNASFVVVRCEMCIACRCSSSECDW